MSQLSIQHLTVGYRGREVLHGLTLAPIESGQLTALVGPNGAGKSTLLRALAGLLPATGSIRLDNEDLLALSAGERARLITLMPQTLPQGIQLTVFEGVLGALHASPLSNAPYRPQDAEELALQALRRLGIEALALTPLSQLSGGERQLASLAQALVREPRVLLLDEPTSALDLRHQAVVMSLAHQLAEENRIVITVLHDLALAARWAHRVIVIQQGEVATSGVTGEAITPEILERVYGVIARVERCSRGTLQVMVDGVVPPSRMEP